MIIITLFCIVVYLNWKDKVNKFLCLPSNLKVENEIYFESNAISLACVYIVCVWLTNKVYLMNVHCFAYWQKAISVVRSWQQNFVTNDYKWMIKDASL